MWWLLFQVIQVLAYLIVIGLATNWALTSFWPNHVQPYQQKVQQAKKANAQGVKLRASGQVIHIEEPEPDEHADPLEATSADEAKAGQVLTDVPTYNPTQEGSWKKNRTVIATAFADVYTPQGRADTVFIWLSGDMLLVKTPKKWRLLTELRLSSTEAQYLLNERLELLDGVKHGEKPDISIKDFKLSEWKINGAYGRNDYGSNIGQSTIECTSMLEDLGEFKNDLPTLAIERGVPINYFDLRADWVGGDPSFKDRTLFAIWAEEGSDCVAYVGRDLTAAEAEQMGVE